MPKHTHPRAHYSRVRASPWTDFFSANCKKEIGFTLDNKSPIILLHETDPARGGAPIEQLMTDCPDEWREQIFDPHRPVIPWLRIKDFKLVSLKMIVSSMLVHQRRKVRRGSQVQSPGDPDYQEASAGKRGFASARKSISLAARLQSSSRLQSPGQDTPDTPPADSDEARVSDAGKRGFASVFAAASRLQSPGQDTPDTPPVDSGKARVSDAGKRGFASILAAASRLQSPGEDTPDKPPVDSGKARVGLGKRGFASARNRLHLTTALSGTQSSSGASLGDIHGDGVWIDGIFVPKTQMADETTSPEGSFRSSRSSRTSSPREPERVPSLLTLGADLYFAGEVTQQQLGFPTSTTLIVSVDNPGAEALVKVYMRASEPIPPLGSNATQIKPSPTAPTPHHHHHQPTPRGAGEFVFEQVEPASPRDRDTSCGRKFAVNILSCTPSPPRIFSPHTNRRHIRIFSRARSRSRSRCARNCRTWRVSRANPDAHKRKVAPHWLDAHRCLAGALRTARC